MSFFEKIISLTNAKPTNSSGSFVGSCPIHVDENPSLSLKQRSEGPPLVHCFAGCPYKEIRQYFVDKDAWPKQKINSKELMLISTHNESLPLTIESTAAKYLSGRGLKFEDLKAFSNLRYHPSLYHKDETGKVSKHPALIGLIFKEGNLISLQRIYISSEFKKLGSPKVLTSFSGGYVPFGDDPIDTLHLAEGIETSLAIYLSLKQSTWAAINAGNLSKIDPPKTVKTIHIWADKDKSGTGQKESYKAAKRFEGMGIICIVHLPEQPIPNGKKSIDYLDVYNLDPGLIIEDSNKQISLESEIKPIKSPKYYLPDMTEEYLPYIIRDWTFKHAARLNIQPEMIVVPLLSIIGSIIGRKLVIRPKKNDDWPVYANLWCLLIAPPGTKKTPAMNISTKTLNRVEESQLNEARIKNEENKDQILVVKSNLKSLNKRLKKAADKEDTETQKALGIKIISQNTLLNSLETKARRFYTNSYTIEKLIDLLEENPNGLLLYRDELSAILDTFNKKGHETDRQFLLEGWNGDGSFKYDTLCRGTKSLSGVSLTVLGGIQPSVIQLVLNEMKNGKSNDGFIQRFQLIVFPNQSLQPRYVDLETPRELDENVYRLLDKVAMLDISKHGTQEIFEVPYVKLCDEAYDLFVSYMHEIEKEIASLEDTPYKNHISKFGKLLSGLILIFHVIDNIETGVANHRAMPHVTQMAIKWTDFFKAHAKKLYDINYNFEALSGFALARKIIDGNVKDGDSLRAIYKNCWSSLRNPTEVELGANFLETHNWLKVENTNPQSGRPSSFLKFHPGLYDFLKNEEWHHDK